MGGNSRIIDRSTGKTVGRAQKVDLSIFSRNKLTHRLMSLFHALNEHFFEMHSSYLWEKELDIDFFSGSSKHFFNEDISDEIFTKYKPQIGDIDIMIPTEKYYLFTVLMQSLESKELSKGITYLGQDRNNFGTTFLSVFRYEDGKNSVDLQIDFESVDWDSLNAEPTEWSKFSHNSAWEDIVEGFKGVHHKFLLINLTRAMSKRDDIVIATPSSTPEKIRFVTGKKAEQRPRELAFSVDRGMRVKYALMKYNDGIPVTVDEKLVYQEIPTSDSVYIRDVRTIFAKIFKQEPTEEEYKMFHSFTGLVELMHMYCDATEVHDCFEFTLQENLFGKNAQILEKNNPILDCEVKMKFATHLYKEFRGWVGEAIRVHKMAEEYMKNFKYEE